MSGRKEQEVLEKIKSTNSLVESDNLKRQMQALINEDMVGYLRLQIAKVNAGSELKNTVVSQILEKLNDQSEDADRVTLAQLVTLLDVVGDQDNQIALGILGILKESQKVIINNPVPPESPKNTNMTSDDMNNVKQLLDHFKMVKDMKKNEMSLEELEKNVGGD